MLHLKYLLAIKYFQFEIFSFLVYFFFKLKKKEEEKKIDITALSTKIFCLFYLAITSWRKNRQEKKYLILHGIPFHWKETTHTKTCLDVVLPGLIYFKNL